MSCRVGMTTDLEGRRRYWESQHPDLHSWEILGTYNTKSKAQEAETKLANQCGCISSPGGDGDECATWYVYKFSFNSQYDNTYGNLPL